jgi:UDP-2,3-diacylglucosamine hydrolase
VSCTLFISDLHLDPARPAVTRALAEFLIQHRDCDQLYILGDLFEAWIGDDDDAPLAGEVTALLRDFSAAGPALFIMPGNRDFLLGQTFCHAVGATLLSDPTPVDLYGRATLLLHGDSLCTRDEAYQAFRKTARDPQWQAQLLNQGLAERRTLAGELRSMSKEANSNKAEDIMDVTPNEVTRVMAEYNVQQLIHGHTHRPARHREAAGERWVLGDWDKQLWFIRADRDTINLININILQ